MCLNRLTIGTTGTMTTLSALICTTTRGFLQLSASFQNPDRQIDQHRHHYVALFSACAPRFILRCPAEIHHRLPHQEGVQDVVQDGSNVPVPREIGDVLVEKPKNPANLHVNAEQPEQAV